MRQHTVKPTFMQHLFSDWNKIISQIKSASRVLLLFDYDGTLTPIMGMPELAILSEESRQLLKALSQKRHFIVGIVSGRGLSDIQSKVGVNGIIYVGNHGFEIEGPGLNYVHPINNDKIKSIMGTLSRMLNDSLSTIRGVIMEGKGFTVSIHYRLVKKEEIDTIKNIVQRVIKAARLSDKVKITHGKKVYEVRPNVHWDKGMATKLIIEKYGSEEGKDAFLPVYVGDDLTDEDAFKVIESYDGVSVYVGVVNPRSIARYHLKTCKEVNKFMRELLKIELGKPSKMSLRGMSRAQAKELTVANLLRRSLP